MQLFVTIINCVDRERDRLYEGGLHCTQPRPSRTESPARTRSHALVDGHLAAPCAVCRFGPLYAVRNSLGATKIQIQDSDHADDANMWMSDSASDTDRSLIVIDLIFIPFITTTTTTERLSPTSSATLSNDRESDGKTSQGIEKLSWGTLYEPSGAKAKLGI